VNSLRISLLSVILCAAGNGLAESPQDLAHRLDAELQSVWTRANVTASAPSDDAEFLRRVTLDIAGRIPTTFEVRTFRADSSTQKRSVCIDRLLESPEYALHWGNVWRREMLPQSETPVFRELARPFEQWLSGELRNRTSYRLLVRKILTASLNREGAAGEVGFLAAGEFKPANLAASSSRVFLGVNLECAQCHDHPFARWSRSQFWSYAAFFTVPTDRNQLEISIPETSDVVTARWLTDDKIVWPAALNRDSGRQVLADWMTSPSNPYLARNAVNRVWAYLMGTGLIEPVDDLSDHNPPVLPGVLDHLAADFTAHDFDLTRLLSTILHLKAYQLASTTESPAAEPALFHSRPVRGLSGEQIHASLLTAAGIADSDSDRPAYGRLPDREQFIAAFTTDRSSQSPRTVLQALELMNGPLTAELVEGKSLRAIAEAPFLSPPRKLETVFLAVLGRPPQANELAELHEVIPALQSGEPDALKAVFWVLINSAEFGVNH